MSPQQAEMVWKFERGRTSAILRSTSVSRCAAVSMERNLQLDAYKNRIISIFLESEQQKRTCGASIKAKVFQTENPTTKQTETTCYVGAVQVPIDLRLFRHFLCVIACPSAKIKNIMLYFTICLCAACYQRLESPRKCSWSRSLVLLPLS